MHPTLCYAAGSAPIRLTPPLHPRPPLRCQGAPRHDHARREHAASFAPGAEHRQLRGVSLAPGLFLRRDPAPGAASSGGPPTREPRTSRSRPHQPGEARPARLRPARRSHPQFGAVTFSGSCSRFSAGAAVRGMDVAPLHPGYDARRPAPVDPRAPRPLQPRRNVGLRATQRGGWFVILPIFKDRIFDPLSLRKTAPLTPWPLRIGRKGWGRREVGAL